jgi:hypothetical protein
MQLVQEIGIRRFKDHPTSIRGDQLISVHFELWAEYRLRLEGSQLKKGGGVDPGEKPVSVAWVDQVAVGL